VSPLGRWLLLISRYERLVSAPVLLDDQVSRLWVDPPPLNRLVPALVVVAAMSVLAPSSRYKNLTFPLSCDRVVLAEVCGARRWAAARRQRESGISGIEWHKHV
jgi:hypothetical protein